MAIACPLPCSCLEAYLEPGEGGKGWKGVGPCHIPFGAAKWMTFPSLLNMLTSSMAWMGWTLSFLRACWSFLSSVADRWGARFIFRRGVPFPPIRAEAPSFLRRSWTSAIFARGCVCG